MDLYLVQHGKPLPKEQDPDKSLSEQGKEDVETVAAFLKRAGISVDEVYHSGKTRAKETAEQIVAKLNPELQPVTKEGISPLDEVQPMAKELESRSKDLMIVGHLPYLNKLASLLTTGDESTLVIAFQQGSVVCLRREEEDRFWTIAWMVVPEIIS